jgi:PAS domain S-box-containing protein
LFAPSYEQEIIFFERARMRTAKTYQDQQLRRFRRRLNVGFVQLLIVLALVIFLFHQNNQSFIEATGWNEHTNTVLYASEQVISEVKDVETGTRGYLLSADENFLRPYYNALTSLPRTISSLVFLTRDNELQQQRIREVAQLILRRIAVSRKQIALRKQGGIVTPEIVSLSRQGARTMDSIRSGIGVIQGLEKKLLVERRQTAYTADGRTVQSVYFFVVFMALTIVGGWVLLGHHFSARMKAEQEVSELNASLEKRIEERSAKLASVEHLLTHTFDSMIEGVQLIDFDWRYSYVNDSVLNYARLDRESMVGKTIMECYPGVEHSELYIVLKQAMEERVPIGLETEFQFPNNTKDWFELNIQPVPDGILILSTLTTSRHEAEALLHEQTALAESLLLAAPDAILEISHDCLIKRTNYEADRMFGYRQGELSGMHISTLFTEQSMELFDTERFDGSDTAGIVRKEITGRRKNGNKFPIEVSLSISRGGRGTSIIGSFRDITEKKKTEAQLHTLTHHLESTVQLRTQQLEAINKELDSFSYSVSHDLRAPLRAIDGYSKILIEDYGEQVDQEGRDIMETIRRNTRRMGQLIDDLLAFSRVGKQLVVSGEVDMNQLVKGIVNELITADAGRTDFCIQLLPPTNGDYNMLKQVLANLISNAVKYSAKRQNPVVEIGSFRVNDNQVYYVKDNGAGFDMTYYDKLFGVFQRLHSTRDFEGTGVGLAIVHRIISRLGGKVWAEGKEDEGATFYFSIS